MTESPQQQTDAGLTASSNFDEQCTITIAGTPYGGKGGVGAWMVTCREQATAQLTAREVKPLSRPVKLVVRFYFPLGNRKHDLDNALKVLIDALGAAGLFERTKNGKSAWTTEDHWVYAIDAEKVIVQSNPRVTVRVLTTKDLT